MSRVYLVHALTGGATEVPDDPHVLADFADRGWFPAEKPAVADVFVPDPSGLGAKKLDPSYYGTNDAVESAEESVTADDAATNQEG